MYSDTLHRTPSPTTHPAGPGWRDAGAVAFSLTAALTIPPRGAHGLIRAHRGHFDSWALYFRSGLLCFAYDVLGTREFVVVGRTRLTAGEHQVRVDLASDTEDRKLGGDVTLFHDGAPVGEGRVGTARRPAPAAEEVAEGTDVAIGSQYAAQTSVFTGTIHWVQLDSAPGGSLVSADDRLRVAMTQL